ncbi:MAG: ComEC/Rec2 family competence protein [Microbacterium sp.]|nr:ComEC/Rec2 family competence protein [Microbacterium sp.]
MVPVAASAWLTAVLLTLSPEVAGAAALVGWVAAVLLLGVAARVRQPTRTWCALGSVTLAVAAAVATHVALALPARDALARTEVDGGRVLTAQVRAVGKIEPSADGWRFDGVLDRLQRGNDREGAEEFGGVPVVVRLSARPDGLDLGAVVSVTGTAWVTDPGQRAVLVIDANGAVRVDAEAAGPLAAASALRRGLVAVSSGLPPPGAGLIAGLAVGDTSAVSPELDAAMKASSLSHLTAVSGANCALIVAGAFGFAALCRARRGVRVAAGLVALASFVVLVSPEPSVVRAAAMAAIAMLGILLGRPGGGLSLLATAVAVLLVSDPWLGLSLGFALSSAATGALLVGAGPLADGLARWMPRPLALGVSVPLAAQLACGPLIVLIAPQLSVYGVVANMLAAPAAPLGTVLGLAACLFAGIPLLGSGLAALAWLPATWISGIATTFADLPGSVIAWPEGVGGLVALSIVGGAVAALVLPTRSIRSPVRIGAAWTLAAAIGVGLALGPVTDVFDRTGLPHAWTIAACDVGQGDAVLVRSAGAVALIDTGPDPAPLARCLDRLGVGHLDLLVLTHFDLDHRGGVAAVQGRVDLVLHGPLTGPEDGRALGGLTSAGATTTQAARGMSGSLGDTHWRVLWPRPDTPGGNDASVVVEFRGGGVPASLFLGDLSAAGQQAMAADAALLSAYDVVKVAHHGSADQDPALYARLHPRVAFVTVGENTYGHPRAKTLDLLAGLGARILRTDQEGLLAAWADSDGLRVWSERAPGRVPPDG